MKLLGAIVILGIYEILVLINKNQEIDHLKEMLAIQKTENKSLRRVLFENDLIPKEFVKESE